jgi:hypothetical protein
MFFWFIYNMSLLFFEFLFLNIFKNHERYNGNNTIINNYYRVILRFPHMEHIITQQIDYVTVTY